MNTQLLYPLSYPIEQNTKYWYFESPSISISNSNILELIQKYHIYTKTEIRNANKERILMDLKVHRRFDANNKFFTQYKILYHDENDNTVIRADNNHPYPHIDLELSNKNKEKRIFDTDPSDYEASINTVLRYAEFYKNPMIGIDYWLYNIANYKKELIYSFFNSNKKFQNTYTAFTDIARLVSIDILTTDNEVDYDKESLARIITNKFIRCKIFEEKYGRPIKIAKNIIQRQIDINLLPFMILVDSNIAVINKVFDINGNELYNEKVGLKGKTTYQK